MISKKEQRIVNAFLRCKIAEEGHERRRITLGDCFEVFELGKSLAKAKPARQKASK